MQVKNPKPPGATKPPLAKFKPLDIGEALNRPVYRGHEFEVSMNDKQPRDVDVVAGWVRKLGLFLAYYIVGGVGLTISAVFFLWVVLK